MVKMITSVSGLRCRICRVTSTPLKTGRRIVDDGGIGRSLERLGNGRLAICRFGNDLPMRLLAQKRAQPPP